MCGTSEGIQLARHMDGEIGAHGECATVKNIDGIEGVNRPTIDLLSAVVGMLAAVIRAVVVINVVLGVAFSPLALDACLMSCQAPASALATSAHHACHTDEGTPRGDSHAGTCGHAHTPVVDGIIRADQRHSARALSTRTAALPLGAARLNVAPITRSTSPPHASVALTPVASSAVPLRV
jgi:hypothetical protein